MSHIALLVFDGLLLLAATSDVRLYRIPNWICVAVAIASLILAFPATPAEALSRMGSFGLVSGIVGVLWLRGLLGGGDLKLLMACALWIPFSGLSTFALALGLASAIQGVATLAWTRMATQTPLAAAARHRLPYGVSIAAAGLVWSAMRYMAGAV